MLSKLKFKNKEVSRTIASINIELNIVKNNDERNKVIVSSLFLLTNIAWSYFNDKILEKIIKKTVYNVTCPNCSGEYKLTKNGKEIIGIKFPIEAKLTKEKISFFSLIIIIRWV